VISEERQCEKRKGRRKEGRRLEGKRREEKINNVTLIARSKKWLSNVNYECLLVAKNETADIAEFSC
jgi:hypothetical protein